MTKAQRDAWYRTDENEGKYKIVKYQEPRREFVKEEFRRTQKRYKELKA